MISKYQTYVFSISTPTPDSNDYGVQNDQQLLIGESTCNARTVGWAASAAHGAGKNWFG
jgi:hypothetical protein